MKISKISIIFISLFLLGATTLKSNADTDDTNTGMVFGTHHAFYLTAPQGWVLDNQSGVSQGLYATFYPKGSSWEKSNVVMYANTSMKDNRKAQDLIDQDVQNYRTTNKTKVIKNAEPLTTKNKKTAVVKYFLGDKRGNYDAVAYIDEKYLVVFLVMSAKSQAQFDQALPAFKQLVSSYDFITDESFDQYSIPPDVLKQAHQDSDSTEGGEYEKIMNNKGFGNEFVQMMNDCTVDNKELTTLTLVLKISKNGTVIKVYGEKHSKIYDCLLPKLVVKSLAPPPHAPFYELMNIEITK